MSKFPYKIEVLIDDSRYWEGLGRQNMAFHQTLGELIDNAIAASGKDAEGELLPFRIEIVIIRNKGRIIVEVADEGTGISLSDLQNKVMSPGGQGTGLGPLNEHGFGLKNALCVMTNGNKLSFKIQTRDKEAVGKNLYYLVRGPFSREMKLDLDKTDRWVENLEHCKSPRGTRVVVETTFEYLRTLWPKTKKELETAMRRLGEHLGVIYRGYLRNKMNKMWLRWSEEEGNWTDKRIFAIEIPYKTQPTSEFAKKSEDFEISVKGVTAKATYTFGEVDVGQSKDEKKGWPYPLEIYYQHNIPTTGIDVCVRGRVVLTQQLASIWPNIHRSPDYNWFVGELILDEKFRTVNNKTALDANNPFWQGLLEKLNAVDPSSGKKKYQPRKGQKYLSEAEIRGKLASILEASIPKSKATQNHPVWSGAGIKIDIHLSTPKGVEVYEIKSGTAEPLHVYQLLMYWDGVVHDTHASPVLGRLVANDAQNSVTNMINDINKRKDNLGNNYNLEFKKITDWKIS